MSEEYNRVEVWIEDKTVLQGPFELFLRRDATVSDLRREAEITLGVDECLQRWVVGTAICHDDSIIVASLVNEQQQARLFLYLVEAETSQNAIIINDGTDTGNTGENGKVYFELVQLELLPIVPNAEAFECEVCFVECGPGEGVVLRDCVHTFCRQCLGDVVRHSEEPQVSCPALGCGGLLQEREVRALVPTEDYERWLRRGLAAAESGTRDAFHCLTRDCAGWALCDPDVRVFPCPVCKCTNCLRCKIVYMTDSNDQNCCKGCNERGKEVLIEEALERVKRRYARLTQLDAELVDALILYHSLMQRPPYVPPGPSAGYNVPSSRFGANPPPSSVEVWIEDKKALHGPFELLVGYGATVGDLRRETEISLGLDSRLQIWVVGASIISGDSINLASLANEQQQARFFLYLVEDEDAYNPLEVYSELVELELYPILPNAEAFECEVCFSECGPGEGMMLRDCIHTFCRQCLGDMVRHSDEPQVSCPTPGCGGLLQEREIRALVPAEVYERWLRRGLSVAERGMRDAFHCLTNDCAGWALCDPDVTRFPCPLCKCTNCLRCKAIHEGTCEEHLAKVQVASYNSKESESSKKLILSLISRGEAMRCPQCATVIMKTGGCDGMVCSGCKIDICWVTRGRRWGPGGKGDTSAGCRCRIGGKPCHPNCGNCH